MIRKVWKLFISILNASIKTAILLEIPRNINAIMYERHNAYMVQLTQKFTDSRLCFIVWTNKTFTTENITRWMNSFTSQKNKEWTNQWPKLFTGIFYECIAIVEYVCRGDVVCISFSLAVFGLCLIKVYGCMV